MIYPAPGQAGAPLQFKAKYDNFINGQWTPPVKGEYFDNITPINGQAYCQDEQQHAEHLRPDEDPAPAPVAPPPGRLRAAGGGGRRGAD